MKTKVLSLLTAIILLTTFANAQISEMGYTFQGYAVDTDGKVLGNEAIKVQFTISNSDDAYVYTEEVDLNTDVFGVFTAVVGEGNPASFKVINYAYVQNLKVEVKKAGGSYTTIHDGQMQAVPYAQYANNGVPVGTILPFGGGTIPDGFLVCDGRHFNRTTYPALYAAIGTAWGTTDGTNFRLPSLVGDFLRGTQPGGSRVVGSYQADATRSHTHTGTTTTDGNHGHVYVDPLNGGTNTSGVSGSNTKIASRASEYPENSMTAGAGDHSHTFTSDATGGSETRPQNGAVYFIIKY